MTEDGRIGELSQKSCLYQEFYWRVPDFYSLFASHDDFSVVSPTFDFVNATWYLRLFQTRLVGHWDVNCEMVRLSSNIPEHRFEIRIALLKNSGEIYRDFTSFPLFKHTDKKEEIALKLCEPGLLEIRYEVTLPDVDIVTFFFRLRNMKEETKVDASFQTELLEPVNNFDILCQNLKGLLLNGDDYDVTLWVQDKEFRAHQCILKARSDVLSSMLTHDMTEKNSGVINIPDCDPRGFEQFLLYLYTGKVEILDESTMLGLYYIADKYNMANLKEECCAFIKKSMSSNVVCHTIQLALNHNDTGLLSSATEYFVENTTEILRTVEWQSFMINHTTYANELFIKAASKWDKAQTGNV